MERIIIPVVVEDESAAESLAREIIGVTLGNEVVDDTVGDVEGIVVGDTLGSEVVGDTLGDVEAIVGDTLGKEVVGDIMGWKLGVCVGINIGE